MLLSVYTAGVSETDAELPVDGDNIARVRAAFYGAKTEGQLWSGLRDRYDVERPDAISVVSLPLYTPKIASAFYQASHNQGRTRA